MTNARKPDPKSGQVGGRGSAEQARGGEGGTHSASWPLWLLLAWVLAASVGQTHVLHGPNAHLAQESEQRQEEPGEGLAATNTNRANQEISNSGTCFQPPDLTQGSLL